MNEAVTETVRVRGNSAEGNSSRVALFSPCEQYRYSLSITWEPGLTLNFLMLNPSTADEMKNDPTVERCQRRAAMLGFGSIIVTNLFAYRATDPRAMKSRHYPVGLENDTYIRSSAKQSALTVCAWGVNGTHDGRDKIVMKMLRDDGVSLYHLGLTKTGIPKHPLYVNYEQPIQLLKEGMTC